MYNAVTLVWCSLRLAPTSTCNYTIPAVVYYMGKPECQLPTAAHSTRVHCQIYTHLCIHTVTRPCAHIITIIHIHLYYYSHRIQTCTNFVLTNTSHTYPVPFMVHSIQYTCSHKCKHNLHCIRTYHVASLDRYIPTSILGSS